MGEGEGLCRIQGRASKVCVFCVSCRGMGGTWRAGGAQALTYPKSQPGPASGSDHNTAQMCSPAHAYPPDTAEPTGHSSPSGMGLCGGLIRRGSDRKAAGIQAILAWDITTSQTRTRIRREGPQRWSCGSAWACFVFLPFCDVQFWLFWRYFGGCGVIEMYSCCEIRFIV